MCINACEDGTGRDLTKYRIFLVEDEEKMRQILVRQINQADNEYIVTGEAANGKEAWEFLSQELPDILLTDINMPVMDGLELIRKVREKSEDLPIVVISGYDDFDYARGAMAMGVREYLLKPFLPKDLFISLDKMRDSLIQRRALRANMEMTGKLSEEYMLRRLLEGNTQGEEIEGFISDKGLADERKLFCAAAVYFPLREQDNGHDDKRLLRSLNVLKKNYVSDYIRFYVVSNMGEHIAILFELEESNKEKVSQIAVSILESIAAEMKQRMQSSLGRPYSAWRGIHTSWLEAIEAWRGVLNSDEAVTVYKDSGTYKRDVNHDVISGMEDNILIAVQMGEYEKAADEICRLLDFFSDYYVGNMEFISISLIKLVLMISDATEKVGGDTLAWNDRKIIEHLKKHFNDASLMETEKVLKEYVYRCCSFFSEINASQSDRIIQSAKLIIEKNLSNDEFGLEMLAEEMHFSPNYIRQLFRENTGISFSTWLIDRRMELAEKLIHNPAYKIQDIAEIAGYSDQRYFARYFKKYFGLTPTDYRKRL